MPMTRDHLRNRLRKSCIKEAKKKRTGLHSTFVYDVFKKRVYVALFSISRFKKKLNDLCV